MSQILLNFRVVEVVGLGGVVKEHRHDRKVKTNYQAGAPRTLPGGIPAVMS